MLAGCGRTVVLQWVLSESTDIVTSLIRGTVRILFEMGNVKCVRAFLKGLHHRLSRMGKCRRCIGPTRILVATAKCRYLKHGFLMLAD